MLYEIFLFLEELKWKILFFRVFFGVYLWFNNLIVLGKNI